MSVTADTYRNKLLPSRQQADLRNQWLRRRFEAVLPPLMAREEVAMWIVAAREYNEDPVLMTMLPAPAMSARRRTILVYHRQGERVERLTLSRYGYEGYFEPVWDPDQESQYACLARIVRERDPETIALNISETFAFGDGLSHGEYQGIAAALGDDLMARVCSGERLCVGWLETRLPEEITVYPSLVELGHAIIAEAFSTRVITPGVTTTEDVQWWMRTTMQAMGLHPWFHPSCEIQAPGQPYDADGGRQVIQPGDLLWCDMGFQYLGLCTDQQQHAYVLKPGETEAPAGLRSALAQANRLQDIHLEEMRIGRTGNQVLAETLRRARSRRVDGQVYSHPLGYHGHAAGPTIGLWDQQGGVPGKGDYPIYDDTCYSIELNARAPVPEWDGQVVRIALEEDAVMTDGAVRWLHGRQTRLHLIG